MKQQRVEPHIQRSNEPVFWGLFGLGGMWSAIVAPAAILILTLLLPLGLLPDNSFEYQQVLHASRSVIGRLFLLGLLILPLWCNIHRLRCTLHDLKIELPYAKILWYGLALLLSSIAAWGVVTL